MKRTAIKSRRKKHTDPSRRDAIHMLECVACVVDGTQQCSPTEEHHVKSGRYSSKKEQDDKTIPLCHSHHNKLRPYPGDEEKVGFHNNQTAWERLYGPDTGYLDATDAEIARLF